MASPRPLPFVVLSRVLLLASAQGGGEPLRATSVSRSMRRVLVGDEVREYAALELRFPRPLYARTCEDPRAIFVESVGRCARCPSGCVLWSLFASRNPPPGFTPRSDGRPECLCGPSYEELRLRLEGWPGDPALEGVGRAPAEVLEPPARLAAYATAVWQYDTLMMRVSCGNGSWPELRRFGLNGLPLAESLWWLRRFDTAFGLEDVGSLLANASREYDDYQAVFFVPVRRTRNGRVWQLGPDLDALASCSLEFPHLAGAQGEPVAHVGQVRDTGSAAHSCSASALARVRKQMGAVLTKLPDASRQKRPCREDWRTSVVPGQDESPGAQGAAPSASGGAPRAGSQLRRIGVLALREDFHDKPPPDAPVPTCRELRWQLRARAHYTRERALAYTATDAVNGCWALMEGLVKFEARPRTVTTDECMHLPETPAFWASPCCNPRALRDRCCAVRNATVLRPVAMGVDADLLGRQCRTDQTGAAAFARSALSAAMAWQRRSADSSGSGSCWRVLMAQEQAQSFAWQTLQRCHADVVGRYDRELRMYAGAPCIVNEDCLTYCVKPALNSLQVRVPIGGLSEEPRQVLGRCHVPTGSQHVYLLRCLLQRGGAEVLEALSRELGLRAPHSEAAVATTLRDAPERVVGQCIGPYAAPGVSYPYQSCLAPEMCNWNHEVDTAEECERGWTNSEFCGCYEGFCFQQSLKPGCVDGTKINTYCHDARELLRAIEMGCAARAATPAAMRRCSELVDAHSGMLRTCLARGCFPPQRYEFSDERCLDLMRQRYSNCHELCTVPSGPNPKSNRAVCFIQLGENETAADCFKTRGDAKVHYLPREDGGDLNLAVPQRRPDFCSVRVWRRHAAVEPARSRRFEAQRFAREAAERARHAEETRKRSEGAARAEALRLARSPPAPVSCDMGVVPLQAASQQLCRNRQASGCCLTPVGDLKAVCVPCQEANTTVCPPGAAVQALWRPNMQPYPARVAADIGGGFGLVDWDDAGTEHRQVPWVWVFTRSGVLCSPVSEGCAAHSHCGADEYCFGCDLCAKAHGGNPPPHLCAPCPTPLGGGCGRLPQCQRLQDGVGGICPPPLELQCPCKAEWSVRFQYEGAPMETSLSGCWYDVARSYHWCEVDSNLAPLCGAQLITGRDRFIYWRRCTPPSCDQCNCDCSRTCMAYNIIPFEGRLPAEVVPGDLGQVLPARLRDPAGLIAPNCSDESFARVRGLCGFCVGCCATFCHSRAEAAGAGGASGAGANASRPFDCTATDVTGCSDSPRGWTDEVGRSCRDYALQNLCTPGGQQGANWIYSPPRLFSDFAMNGRAATDACCACGGGSDCSDRPNGWQDPAGVGCEAYAGRGWCNRTGYGPGWDAAWGTMALGTDGVDALSACCSCGGGGLVAPPASQLLLVDDPEVCRSVWPGRARFQSPPWLVRSTDHCRLISGICMRKLTAMVYTPGLSSSSPDDTRIYGLCEQRAFLTGKVPLKEDLGRQLAALDQTTGRVVTALQEHLQARGTSMGMDFWGNTARGMCYYRLPDPFGLFGGPRRQDMPPPWLPPKTSHWDLFEPPSLQLLGWPSDFWRALPESQAALRRPQLTPQAELVSASSALRAALASAGVELVRPATFEQRLGQWQAGLASAACTAAGLDSNGKPDLTKFRRDVRWDPARLSDEASCVTPRCDLDDRVLDREACPATVEGCTAHCPYCASSGLATREQGVCYTSRPAAVARCDDLGGIVVDGAVFDEALGVSRPERLCAMPHRPLVYCTAPGEQVKRCAHFEVDQCESDPVARLLGCAVGIRRCQNREECRVAGRCSDTDAGLTWALPGTCVVTPLDDETLRRGCGEDGLCYSRLDPPFGMEVRWRHGLLDLLGPQGGGAGADARSPMDASGTELGPDGGQRLRSAGRLNRTECEALRPGHGRRAIWLQRSRDILECRRWHGCCLVKRGDVCELFSGPVIDEAANSSEFPVAREECVSCGGEWAPVFRWKEGVWRAGRMEEQTRKWLARRWTSANEWAEVVDISALRQLFENAAEQRLGKQRLNAAKCLLEPLMVALSTVAAACGRTAASEALADDGSSAASQLPSARVSLGSVEASSGLAGYASLGSLQLSWHEFSASLASPSTAYELALEPLEFELAMAAPQIALPSRPDTARSRIVSFALTGETTTTAPPQYDTNRVDAGANGYPSWLINEMMEAQNPELLRQEEQRNAMIVANAEARKQQRLEMEQAFGTAADASSGLPAASQAVVLGAPAPSPPALAPRGAPLDLSNETCRTSVTNVAGQVMGQLLGDCVRLDASSPLVNAVELCVPLMHESTLEATPHGAALGVVLDFARKELVPEAYNMSTPPPLGATIPGQLASQLWLWESGARYGRLPPGWSVHTALGLQPERRWQRGGALLCARVFHAGWTYCPIARLAAGIHSGLPLVEAGGAEVPPLDSACPQLDAVLASVQVAQSTANISTVAYRPLDMQVSASADLLAKRPAPQAARGGVAACLAGQCLAMRGREFQVVPKGAADCVLPC